MAFIVWRGNTDLIPNIQVTIICTLNKWMRITGYIWVPWAKAGISWMDLKVVMGVSLNLLNPMLNKPIFMGANKEIVCCWVVKAWCYWVFGQKLSWVAHIFDIYSFNRMVWTIIAGFKGQHHISVISSFCPTVKSCFVPGNESRCMCCIVIIFRGSWEVLVVIMWTYSLWKVLQAHGKTNPLTTRIIRKS